MVVILGFDVRDAGKIENDREHEHDDGHDDIRNVKRLTAGAFSCGVFGIKKRAADDRAKDPTDAVAGLRKIDAGGRVLLWPQHGRVGIGDRFQEGKPDGNGTNTNEVADESGVGRHAAGFGQRTDMRGRKKPESAHRDHQETRDDAALVAEPVGQQAGRQRHEKISQVMRELHPGGL